MTLPTPFDLRSPKIILITLLLSSISILSSAQCNSGNEASFTLSNTFNCDSTVVEITNTSTLDLSRVSYFKWDFGDGSIITGDSNTNTDFYVGANNDGVIEHTYRFDGTYDIELTVEDDSNCQDVFKIKGAVTNINPQLEIEHQLGHLEADFWLKNGPPASANSWRWNFGDPASGPENFNQDAFEVHHDYSPGAYMISFEVTMGPCRYKVFDTVQIIGPAAVIETAFNRIAYAEKYQCTSNDTVHFTNSSIFYQNDSDPTDEDSTITVNGESLLVFNYNEATGAGDQVAVPPAYTAGRTDENVVRVWDFGDKYAPQCTTSTTNNINVGLNCNWSTDEFPAHKYMEWDSIYYYNSFIINDSFERYGWSDSLDDCYNYYVDTTSPDLHRKMFDWYNQTPYQARLWLKDTVSLTESTAYISIVIGKPNAKKLTTDQQNFCALDASGNLSYYNEFKLNTGGQSYFAVNFDSLANPNGFTAFNSGGVLAAPAPGTPLPFVLPYDLVGNFPDKFVKGYTPGEIGPLNYRDPNGSFTLGLIVGNGPIPNGQTTPACLDTAWYHDMFRIKPLVADFEALTANGSVLSICEGESVYFKMASDIQSDISSFRWNWGYQGFGDGYNLDAYVEEFHYLEDYTGPVTGRNDENISYNNENWKYNYVIRSTLNNIDGVEIIDTIVTSIVKEWKTEVEEPFTYVLGGEQIPYPDGVSAQDYAKMLGKCIDTTGLSEQFTIKETEYRSYNGDATYMLGDKRYRYTNAAKTDSIEVAHVLHFRDSSLQGFDTLIVGTDTTFGVWKKDYTYEKDGKISNSNGPLLPSLSITNTSGCVQRGATLLNVGFYNEFWLDKDSICEGITVNLDNKIRYWQIGDQQWPNDWPFDPRDFWHNPDRYLNNIEIFAIDWDSTDGLNDWERSIAPSHIYDQAGDYTVTIHSKDSTGCHDTARINVHVADLNVDFAVTDNSSGCDYDFVFSDNSTLSTGDEVLTYLWSLEGNKYPGSVNKTYRFGSAGDKNVKLEIQTKFGCLDSLTKTVSITNASSLVPPAFTYSINDLSLTTINQSDESDSYVWLWGDGDQDTAYDATHDYGTVADFDLCLRRIDTSTNCSSDSCIEVPIGYCNALFGYLKDTSTTYSIVVLDSSTGPNLAYTWYWGDGDSSTIQRPSHDYSTFGKFLLTLKVETGNCISIYADSLGMDSAGNLLKVDGFTVVVDKFTSISDLPAGEALIYPNPASELINIQTNLGVLEEVRLVDMNGKEVNTEVISKQNQLWQINVADLTGSFVVHVKTDRGYLSYKLVIE